MVHAGLPGQKWLISATTFGVSLVSPLTWRSWLASAMKPKRYCDANELRDLGWTLTLGMNQAGV